MEEGEFEFDVALSFADEDHDLAKEIAELLKDRANVFIYSERQLDLAATDGVDEFTSVFRRRSKVVVAIVREKWGKTKWTRVEETAIKNRGFDEGYDFLVVIPLGGRTNVPDWVPQTQIWADLDRLSVQGAVAVVERKLQSLGKTVRPETAEDLAGRLARQAEATRARSQLLGSADGVRKADEQFETLYAGLQSRAKALGASITRDRHNVVVITKDTRSLTLSWRRTYGNTLNDSQMWVKLWDGVVSDRIDPHFRAKRATSEMPLQFDVSGESFGWREERKQHRFFPNENLSDHILKALLLAADGQRATL